MEYRRRESFRHVLVHEVPVTYNCQDGGLKTYRQGEIVEISPSGLKLFTEENLPCEKGEIELDLSFKLYSKPINVRGDVRWKKVIGGGYQYGVFLNTVDEHQELIISELKLRRRKEVFEFKRQNS
ncbi:PilZ domain-containing protein [Rummeliibacillus sp. NPDC094406]|uniref:PilZ domain-containing protein n=1 Tax=Rummeliibacillus sp. NPDC094406 TaxID=3364511 RepID=UPI0038260777